MTHFETLLLDNKQDQVYHQVDDEVGRQVGVQVWGQVEDQILRQVRVQAQNQIWLQVREDLV
jgi:hypothetical protein